MNETNNNDNLVLTNKPEVENYLEMYETYHGRISFAACKEYLNAHGVSMETAKRFKFGFDEEWKSPTVVKAMEARGESAEVVPATPRLIIPVNDHCYIARDIRADLTDAQAQRVNLLQGRAGTFNKGALYDEEANEIFVTSDVLEAISIVEAGGNAVSICNYSRVTAFLNELATDPIKTGKTLIICMDGTPAGEEAAIYLRKGLTRLNISYFVADICGSYGTVNARLSRDRAGLIEAIQRTRREAMTKPDNTSEYINYFMVDDIKRYNKPIKTGYPNFDEKTGGLNEGLYCIAAISSLGKTTFISQMADQIAGGGNDVLFFSLEQSRLELVSKSIARITAKKDLTKAVTSLSIRKGYLPESVREAAKDHIKATGDRISIIEGNFNCNITFIAEYIRKYITNNNCKPVVFIDYLQILEPEQDANGRKQSTKDTIDAAITQLKRLSRELGITVFVVSSVNRHNYLTPIDFESLKESGGIEYTCDFVCGLQLAELTTNKIFEKEGSIKEKREAINKAKAANPRQIELVCLKNRYGIANFSCNFEYYPANDLFEPVEPKHAGISF